MKNAKKDTTSKEEPVAEPDYTEKIKLQVLAKVGRLPRLDFVEVSRHHNHAYRVNIWQHPEPNKDIVVTIASRIGLSYYLKVSDTGDIIESNPPLTKLSASA